VVKEVDLLSYWMPVLRQLKEFKEIAKAEEPELRYLFEACDRAIRNFFIPTADEQGISLFEGMLGMFPDEGADLETRRVSVLTAWASKERYTDAWLYDRLSSLCGGEVSITPHYEEYSVDIAVESGVKGIVEILTSLISDILPCNLVYNLSTYIKAQETAPLFVGVVTSTAMCYQLTNDITSKVSTVSTLNNAVANSTATVITINSETVMVPTTAVLGKAVLGSAVLGTM